MGAIQVVGVKGTENLLTRFFSIFSGRVLTTIIAFVSTPLIVRFLGPAHYGDYAVLLSVVSLYMIPISSFVTEGVQKFISENRDSAHWQEHVFQFYLLLAVTTVTVGAILLVGFTAAGGATAMFGEGFTGYFYLLAGYILVSQFRAITYYTVLGMGLEPISESLNVVKKVVTISLGIGLVVVGFGVNGMIAGHAAANLLVAVAGAYVIGRQLSIGALFRLPESFPYRELLSFNVLNILLVLLVMSLIHVDVVMLGSLADSESTGFYKAALAVAEFLWVVPMTLHSLLIHSSSRLWSDGRQEQITELAARITRYTVLLVVLMAVGLAALADQFVPLYYGAEFEPTTSAILLLLPGVIGFAAARPLLAISQGSGEIRTLIVGVAGAAAANLLLNGLLIPRFGMNGAAVATSTAYGSMFLFLVWAARRIGYRPLADIRAPRIAATVAISAPIVFGADWVIGNDLVALIVVPPIGAVVYGAAAIATGALGIDEVLDLLGKVPGPVGSAAEIGRVWAERLRG